MLINILFSVRHERDWSKPASSSASISETFAEKWTWLHFEVKHPTIMEADLWNIPLAVNQRTFEVVRRSKWTRHVQTAGQESEEKTERRYRAHLFESHHRTWQAALASVQCRNSILSPIRQTNLLQPSQPTEEEIRTKSADQSHRVESIEQRLRSWQNVLCYYSVPQRNKDNGWQHILQSDTERPTIF